MGKQEDRVKSEEQSKPLTDADELLARFFDVLIEMDFEQQRRQQMEGNNESI